MFLLICSVLLAYSNIKKIQVKDVIEGKIILFQKPLDTLYNVRLLSFMVQRVLLLLLR